MKSELPSFSDDIPVRIYSPSSVLRRPVALFREMGADIAASWELAVALARRELSARYRQSFLGYVWAFLPVLGTTGVFLFLRSGGALSDWDHPIDYPVYLLIGSVLWQVFADAVQGPLRVVTASRAMLVKINFPREALVSAAMLVTWFNFAVRLAILIPALIYFSYKGQFTFDWSAVYAFPLGVAGLVLLGYTIGLLLTPVGMLYKDIQMGVGMILGFWMFLSPVVVTIPNSGGLATFMHLNPVTPMIDTARAWLVGAETPLLGNFLWVAAGAFVFLLLGWLLFRVALPHVIARLGM
jgi:lipopolysaccharide transport system permease protein